MTQPCTDRSDFGLSSRMDPVPVLVGVEGGLVGQRFVVTAQGLRLGREPGNEVCLDDTGVSRQHARVILHNGAVWVQDAGSRNGVFVNGERVADHRTLKAGDRFSVGTHFFELQFASGAPPAPRAPAPPPAVERTEGGSVRKGWKVWPFALAIFGVVSCIGCFGAYGWIRGDSSSAATAPAPSYSLSTVLPADGLPPTAAGGAPPPALTDALAVAAGQDADAQRAQLPQAPAGSSATELVERAHAQYETGRLNDARTTYQMALRLDPSCEICSVRIERLNGEISQRAQTQLDAGLRYWDSMQVQQAIASWETVLLLVPDPVDPLHQRATEALARARKP
jgi:hypothetical protein